MSDMFASDKEIDTSSTISSNVHGGQEMDEQRQRVWAKERILFGVDALVRASSDHDQICQPRARICASRCTRVG